MSGVSNPYRSPDSPQKDQVNGTVEGSGNVLRDLICWPILFGINMIIPLLFGWSTLRDHGKAGAAAATVLLLSISLAVLLSDRVWKRRLYLGGFLVSLAQLFPVMHLIVGMISIEIVRNLRLGVFGTETEPDHVTSEAGGFLIVLLVGGSLLLAASLCGWFGSLIFRAKK